MSDMNLPTVTVKVVEDAEFGEWVALIEPPIDRLHDALVSALGALGTHTAALVPVDAMEKVWLCAPFPSSEADYRSDENDRRLSMHQECGWRWLVSAKEEE